MAEPTSAYTYRDLIAKVAKERGMAYYGGGTGPALIPADDDFNLDECREIVNDAIKMFIADAPRNGWRWMRRVASVNIDGTRVTGTVDSASATTVVDATLSTTYDTDDDLNGYWCYILTGTGAGSFAQITDYTASTGTVTVADWLDQYGNAGGTDPIANDTFAITRYETVGGDIARYPLPEYFGGVVTGKISYAADSSHSTSIEWVDEALIRKSRATTVVTGYPLIAAYRPLEPLDPSLASSSIKRRWELILDPQPSASDTLLIPYELYFDKLDLEAGIGDSGGNTTLVDAARTEGDDYFNGWRVEIIYGTGKGSNAVVTDYTGSTGTFTVADWLTAAGAAGGTNPGANSVYVVEPLNNRHPAGFRFDEAILAACMYKTEEEDDEVNKGFVEKYIKKALPAAHRIDMRSHPRTLGSMNRGVGVVRERTWSDITTDHDV